jgi:hypothetical protein
MEKKNFRFDQNKLDELKGALEQLENATLQDMGENIVGGIKGHSQTHSQSGSGHSQTHSSSM